MKSFNTSFSEIKSSKWTFCLFFLTAFGSSFTVLNAQLSTLSYPTVGATITQNFDGLGTSNIAIYTNNTGATQTFASIGAFVSDLSASPISISGLSGWELYKKTSASTTTLASLGTIVFNNSTTGGNGVGGFYKLGPTAEKSLGGVFNSNVPGAVGVIIQNNTSSTITSFTVSYTGEQWRANGANGANGGFTFSYAIGTAAAINDIRDGSFTTVATLNFACPTSTSGSAIALDGNSSANRTVISSIISGVNWAPTQKLVLLWDTGTNGLGEPAIDDFSFVSNTVLDVELSEFSANNKENNNILTWSTTSEKDNATFQIERSADGTNFQTIGAVKGNGTTNAEQHYSFSDETPLSMSYYRLRQTDINGTETVSKIISVARGKATVVKVYPSVASTVLTIETAETTDKATLTVTDIVGRMVLQQKVQSLSLTQLDISSLAKGWFVLEIDVVGKKDKVKFIKQ